MLWVKMRVKEERDEEPEEEDLSNSSSSSIYLNSRTRNNNGSMVCDACGKRSARWYCSADDAYLCHSCDQSVHAANAVSLRHERVSLLLEDEEEEAAMNPVIQKQSSSVEQQQQWRRQQQQQPFSSESSRHDDDGCGGESKSFKSSSNGGGSLKRRRRRSRESPLPPASPMDLKDGNSPRCCKSKKMIKLEAPELVQEASSAEQQWEHEEEEEEQENANVEQEEEEVHTVPVFVSAHHQPSARNDEQQHEFQTEEDDIAQHESLQVANIGSDHSPTSGIATEAEQDEQEEGQEADEEDSMDEADIERFLNSGADYCCDDDEDAEMGSLIAAPPPNTTTTATACCAEDLEFLGFCCDEMSRSCPGFEQQQQLDEDYFDFAIRKNNASVSDYGEVITGGAGDAAGGGIDSLKIKVEKESSDFLGDILGGSMSLSNAKLEHENYDQNFQQMQLQRRICLRLDYEDVLNAWSDRRPFLTADSSSAARGSKPTSHQLPEDSSASDVAGSSDVGVVPDLSCGSGGAGQSVDQAGQVPVVNLGDDGPNAAASGGREARVTRYREKRRTRLFSKKIRYEVRKLNAERRPRLKGRFVKRCSNGD